MDSSKRMLKIWINMQKGELEDGRKNARDVSNKGHLGERELRVTSQIRWGLCLYSRGWAEVVYRACTPSAQVGQFDLIA